LLPGPGWALVRPRKQPEKLAASAVRAVTGITDDRDGQAMKAGAVAWDRFFV
jgi:hypothetical protein